MSKPIKNKLLYYFWGIIEFFAYISACIIFWDVDMNTIDQGKISLSCLLMLFAIFAKLEKKEV